MAQEEKAKAYDEAVKRAKAAIDMAADKDLVGGVVRTIFPELAESEDERIRKELKEAFEAYDIESKWNGIPIRSIFAWLEKQKENPKSSDSIPSDCTSDAKCGNSRHKVGDTLESRKLADEVVAYLIKSGYQPIIKDTLDQKHFQIKIPRHKEDFFLSTEYKYCREILDEYYYEGDFAGDVYTLYVLKQKEQKPVSISCGHENDAEWGQEDKEKIVTISEIIEHCTTIPYSGGTLTLNKEYKKELLCFIKSLRHSWKPSEEQMKALEHALISCEEEWAYQDDELRSLLDDLKKL